MGVMDECEKFFKETVPDLLDKLNADTKPEWGLLNAQAMIEHLVSSWRIANGKAKAQKAVPDDQIEAYRGFLFSDQGFERNIKNPILPENEAPALKKPDIKAAKGQLKQEIEDFFAYHEAYPDAQPVHPLFGPLDKNGWLVFQEKHVSHHFKQFGLLD